jgi:acyl-coenzyme A synthetase/AMP-(fatty) acid ligase/thioesterase domain-containing protein
MSVLVEVFGAYSNVNSCGRELAKCECVRPYYGSFAKLGQYIEFGLLDMVLSCGQIDRNGSKWPAKHGLSSKGVKLPQQQKGQRYKKQSLPHTGVHHAPFVLGTGFRTSPVWCQGHQPVEYKPQPMEFCDKELKGSVVDRFLRVVEMTPDAVAVRWSGREITYRELHERTDHIARALTKVTAQQVVPFSLDAGAGPIEAVISILKAGKTFLALDPSAAPSYHEELIRQTGSDIVLVDQWTRHSYPQTTLNIDKLEDNSDVTLPPAPDSLQTASLIFTSGTTGVPKGVVRSHKALLHRAYLYQRESQVGPGDRQALLAGCHFVASETDLFGAVLNGVTLCPFPSYRPGLGQLERWIRKEGITLFHPPVAFFRRFARHLEPEVRFEKVRLLALGGEPIHQTDWTLWKQRFPNASLVYRYSSSEAGNITQITYPPEAEAPYPISVGPACPDKKVVIQNDDGNRCEVGEEGQIVVESEFLFSGYWPQQSQSVGRYATGDRGVMTADNQIILRGRIDKQRKVRGFRVDLGLVESVILSHPEVEEVAVGVEGEVLFTQVSGSKQLNLEDLIPFCRERLPPGHHPNRLTRVDGLPLNQNGKVDRDALAQLERHDGELGGLCDIWSRVLSLPVKADDDFFALGGTSLGAAQIAHELEIDYDIPLSPSILSRTPTPRSFLEWRNSGEKNSLLIPLNDEGARQPIFCVHPNHGQALSFTGLSRRLGRRFYAFRARGLARGEAPQPDIGSMATEYLAEMRRVQPEGPYILGGRCIGGVIAYEMARMLLQVGQQVETLFLLDSIAPKKERGRFARAVWRADHTLRWLNQHLSRPQYIAARLVRRASGKHFWKKDEEVSRDQWDELLNHMERLEMFHSSSPCPIRPLLIVSDHEHGRRSAEGWKAFLPQGGEKVEVPCDHLELLQEPYVRDVACTLQAVLC